MSEQTSAPGADAAVTAPGAEAVGTDWSIWDASPEAAPAPLNFEQFNEMFPDAADTKMFSAAGGQVDGRRSALVEQAMTYLGTPYVWGGDDRDGVDCSGLVQQVFGAFGVDVPRLSADQARSGAQVNGLKNLRAGDLVAWDNSDRNNGADHIAIYAGDGYIIEAPRPGLAVRKRRLGEDEGWYGVRIPGLG